MNENEPPASEVIILETPRTRSNRMFNQLEARRVDSGQYYAGKTEEEAMEMAEAWEKLSSIHPMRRIHCDPENLESEVTVIDLGSGSGTSFVQSVQQFSDRIKEAILVDTLRPELDIAAKNIWQNTHLSVKKVVANFLEDASEIAELMEHERQRIVLCLGGNIGNYDQTYIFKRLKDYLRENDQLWLGVGYYDPNVSEQLQEAANFYMSPENCEAALLWLKRCGSDPSKGTLHSHIDKEFGARVVRIFFEFTESTELKVNGNSILFDPEDIIQFVESRRYKKKVFPKVLKRRYGYNPIHIDDFGDHGVVHVQKV